MSNNKKRILLCVIALMAVGIFLGVQGRKQEKDLRKVVAEPHIVAEIEGETESVESATPATTKPEAEGTSAPVAEDKKGEKQEEKTHDEKNKADTKKDSSNQENQANSSDVAKNTTSKAKKSTSQDLSKTSKKDITKKKEASASAKPQMETTAKPMPTATAEVAAKKQCNITVTCKDAFGYKDKWNENAKKVIPESGILLQGTFEIQEGETVFDVLKRACKEKQVLLDYVFTPMYSTYYIKGIGNLYEFDCGGESGWMYAVDGKSPGYGCSQYKLNGGEDVVFYYTCEK